ncbi:MAG TPA: serine/threonine-protein kinase [Polyangiaceae bacterium]
MVAQHPAGAPRIVGRYAIYDRIASGGMATVHLGRLLGPVGFARTVAIKRLHAHFAEDPQFVSMFLDEARVAARISHPNVVQTLDVVASEDDLFLVMDYVQGESLSRLLRLTSQAREPIHPSMAATMLAGVLHGLHAAHEARGERGELLGIVHRDVSPQNVIVGIDGVARVLDFGVAKAAGRFQNTRAGQLKGKIAYMAPEQIGGTVSRATDVYAASIVLWETLTGRRLYTGENEADIMKRVLEGCSVRPSQLAQGIPPALDALTMRGLASDPAQRPATAEEMALALEDCVPQVPASRVGRWVQHWASETISQRSQRIAAIESDSAMRPASPGAAPPVADDQLPTQMSSGTVSNAGGVLSAPPAPKRWIGWVVGVGVSLMVIAVALRAFTMRRARSTATPAAAAASAPAAQSSAIPSADDSIVPEPAAVPSVSASASPASSAPPRGAPPRPAAAPARPKAQCDPPYYFDAQGNHHFKPECL